MEELKALYESYIAQGLLSSETTFEQFLNADDSIKESLHKQGVDSKVISNQTDLETFKSAWGDVKKKDSDLPVQEEVTESITEVETPDTSLESSEETVELEDPKKSFDSEVFREMTPEEKISTGTDDYNYLEEIKNSAVGGWYAGSSVDEAFDVYKEGKNISSEDLQDYIKAADKISSIPPSRDMQEFTKISDEAGGGVWGFVKGISQTGSAVIPQVIAQSMTTMGKSLFDSEEVAGTALLSAGVGAAAGAGIGSTGFSLGPLGVLTTAGGAIAGTISGFIGGLTGTMETGLVLTEFLKEELGDKEFNEENIRDILEDEELFNKMKQDAVRRGVTIGAVEAATAGLSRGIATNLAKKGLDAPKIAARITPLEMAGGGLGETGGRLAAGQELSATEIGLETIAESKGLINVSDVLSKAQKQQPTYTINGGRASKQNVIDLINSLNKENIKETVAKINIKNDPETSTLLQDKLDDISLETQIPDNIANPETRTKLVELEKERKSLENKTTQSAKNRVIEIDNQIKNLQQDAIQEQETGDILDAEPAESVQEVEEEVREPSIETEEEAVIKDSQIPTSKEIYTIETEEGEGVRTVEITINKDGSRSVVQKVDGDVASSDNIPAANTVNNNEYVEGSFGPIVGEPQILAMEEVMNPKMKDKLTTKQKQELGIEEETPAVEVVEEKTTKQTSKAESLKRRINKASKSPNIEGTVAQSVKEFLRINPRTVSDIDAYISQAESIVEGLKKSKTFKGDVKIAESVDIKKVDEYSSKELKVQEQTLREQEAKAFEELTGLSSEELSLGEMREILNSVDEESVKTPEEIKLKAEKKADIIAKGIKKAFSVYSAVIKKQIKTGVDPFTGEKIKISANDQKIIQNFLKVDLDNLSPAEQLRALDALTNFATNQTTGGMNATISQDKGVKEAKSEEKKGLVAKSLRFLFSKSLSQEYLKNFAQFPVIQEFMFRSQEKAKRFSKASGFTGITKGVAKADKEANQVFDNYFKKFYKKSKPNGQAFNTIENDVERGMFAFMRRTVDGTLEEQQQEFKRRKGLIEQSIDKLKETGETNDQKKAKVYEEVYNKILKEANNINDIDFKVDPLNKEAVDWVTNEWSSRRDELADISLNVYNRILGKDINYTPDSFTLVETPSLEQNIGDPIFEGTSEVIYDKETGVLKPKKPSFALPENRIVNLGFDSQNSRNLGAALTDIYTAESIQQLKGFVNSDAYSKIIPNKSDRDLVTEKFKKYIASKRGVDYVKYSKFVNGLNKFGSLNVGRALGGPTQFIKQLTPLVNTLINSGPVSTIRGMTLLMNPDVNKFLNNSGYGIANRGLQSLSFLESNNSKIENAAKTTFGKAFNQLNKVNQAYLQAFVANPDKLAARASWLSYYTKSLQKQGINPSGIDWNTHKINEEAADFAEQQVGRQQNVSDVDLQGDIFNSKKPYTQLFRKIMLPFANFVLNQKVRMVSDVTMLTSKMSTTQDKAAAARSIGGLAAETALFNALGLFISEMLDKFTLEDEDEEDKLKSKENRRKGRIGNIVKDVLSPLPLVDVPTIELANYVLRQFADEEPEEEIQLSTSRRTAQPKKKEPFQLFSEDRKEFLDQLGVLGITGKNAVVVYDLGRMAYSGEYQKKYKGEKGKVKKIDPKYKDAAKINLAAYVLYSMGLLPSDVATVVKGNIKDMQREKKEIKLSTSR